MNIGTIPRFITEKNWIFGIIHCSCTVVQDVTDCYLIRGEKEAICYCSCTVEQDQTILFESRGRKVAICYCSCTVVQDQTVLFESRGEEGGYLLL